MEANNQHMQNNYLQNLQAKATAQASSAGAGVAGNSIENLFRGYDRATAINNYLSERNLRLMGMQYDDNYQWVSRDADISSWTDDTGISSNSSQSISQQNQSAVKGGVGELNPELRIAQSKDLSTVCEIVESDIKSGSHTFVDSAKDADSIYNTLKDYGVENLSADTLIIKGI